MVKNLIHKKDGISLVEVIVSLALLALIVVMLFSVVMVSLDSINANAKLKKSDADAAAGLEHKFSGDVGEDADISYTDSQFIINFDEGYVIVAEGEQIISKDKKEGAVLRAFEPS